MTPSPHLSIVFWILGALLIAAQGWLILGGYAQLPGAIPAFVDLAGNPTLTMAKSPLAVMRLPAMALLLLGVCGVMGRVSLKTQAESIRHRNVWAAVAMIAAAKAFFSTLDLLPASASMPPFLSRALLLGVSALGVVMLARNAYPLLKAYGNDPAAYGRHVPRRYQAVLSALLVAYAAVVAAPWILR